MVGRREVLTLSPFLLRPWWMKNLIEGARNLQLEKGTLFRLDTREGVIRSAGFSLGLGQRQVDRLGGPLCRVQLPRRALVESCCRKAWGETQAHCPRPLPATSPAMLRLIVCPGTWNV